MMKKAVKKPRTFAISVDLDKKVERLVKEMDEKSYSSTLCTIIEAHIHGLPYEVQRRLRDGVEEAFPTTRVSICPSCGDTQNVVNYPDGRWRCNLCMEEGTI